MFGINEILEKAFFKKPLTKEERIKILRSKRIDPKVIEYLIEKLDKLYIEVLGDCEGSLFQLMPIEKLMGWCWQTTESVIVFLNDDDYIERGNLYFDERTPKYYHSWICFNYNGIEYVLDSCLNFLCKKDDYSKIFETDVKVKVSAKAVKEELIRRITALKEEDSSGKMKNEVTVPASVDVNAPLYRNGAKYKIDLEDGVIKKLTVHYYYIDR